MSPSLPADLHPGVPRISETVILKGVTNDNAPRPRARCGTKPNMTSHSSPRSGSRFLLATLLAPLFFGLSGCTELTQFLAKPEAKPATEPAPEVAAPVEPEPIPEPQEKPKPGALYEWNGDGRNVSRIVVDTNEQKARFYDGDEQIGWTMVASGVSKHATPVGHFEVIEKVANKRSNLYGKIRSKSGKVLRSSAKAGKDAIPAGARFEGAKMPYFMRLTYDGIGLHAGPIPRPGRPASHGCIRMPSKMAPVLFKHVNVGTRVSIVGKGPNYGNYAEKQRVLAAERAAREREQREIAARNPAPAPAATPPAAARPSTPTKRTPAPVETTVAQAKPVSGNATVSPTEASTAVISTPEAKPVQTDTDASASVAAPSTASATASTTEANVDGGQTPSSPAPATPPASAPPVAPQTITSAPPAPPVYVPAAYIPPYVAPQSAQPAYVPPTVPAPVAPPPAQTPVLPSAETPPAPATSEETAPQSQTSTPEASSSAG